MPKRTFIGTDIATIGVWDPAHERHDLGNASYDDYQAGLKAEARAGRLFFVNTAADGEYVTDIYVSEEPDPKLLIEYSATDREFLIESQSGQLVAGGIEDFINARKQITSEQDQFQVEPGFYALKFYELIDEPSLDRVRDHIGADDYAYYECESNRYEWKTSLFVVLLLLLIAQQWLIAAAAFAIWLTYLLAGSRRRNRDPRFQQIATRIASFHQQFPPFIYTLRRISETDQLQGGWHELR